MIRFLTIFLASILIIVFVSLAITPHSAMDPFNDSGMWIIGPDLSPDSLEMQLLYYTPDAGSTITCIDTILPDSYEGTWRIATDCCSRNFLYLTDAYVNLWVSSDGGFNWDATVIRPYPYMVQGTQAGMVYLGLVTYVQDYGSSLFITECNGLPSIIPHWFSKGWNIDELITSTSSDPSRLYLGTDFADTFSFVNDVDFDEFFIDSDRNHLWYFKGGDDFGGDSIFYTEDFCTTRTLIGITPRFVEYPLTDENTHHDYFKGNNSGEIYAVYMRYNSDESISETYGGWIRVCYSDDYGANFNCMMQSAETHGIDEKVVNERPHNHKLFTYSNNTLISNSPLRIFDISGKLITTGNVIDMSTKSNGLFIVTDGINTRKIVNIK